jgi:hypothetical protein
VSDIERAVDQCAFFIGVAFNYPDFPNSDHERGYAEYMEIVNDARAELTQLRERLRAYEANQKQPVQPVPYGYPPYTSWVTADGTRVSEPLTFANQPHLIQPPVAAGTISPEHER